MCLGIASFFILVCVAIYAVLVQNMVVSDNIIGAMFTVTSYTVLLCFSLLKTGTYAKAILNAH